MTDSVTEVLARARMFKFVREVGPNAGRWVEAIQRVGGTEKGQPWCACYVSFILGIWFDGKPPLPFTASCDVLLEAARAKGVLFDDPEPGDVFLLLKSAHDAEHTGFVTTVGKQKFGSIEGNASDPDSPPTNNGWGVFERDVRHKRARSRGPNTKYVRWHLLAKAAS